MTTLGDSMLSEIRRCSKLAAVYDSIPTGAFGAAMIRKALDRAQAALTGDDPAEMIRAHEALKECQ